MGFTKNTNYLPKFKNQESIYSFSLSDDFIHFQKTYPTPLHIYDDNHWGPGGHYLAAQVIYNFLISNKLIPEESNSHPLIEISDPKNINAFNKINENFVKNSEAKNYLDLLNAIVHKNSGHSKLAIDSYLNFLKENNDEFEIHLQLAKTYFDTKDFDKAFKHMKIASSGKSKTRSKKAYQEILAIFKLNFKIETLLKNKKFKEAIHTFENHPSANKNQKHKLYFGIGMGNLGLKNYQAAEEFFIKAIKLKPNITKYHLNLAHNYFMKKDFQKAITSYSKSLSLKKDQPTAYWFMAISYLNLKNMDMTLSTFKKGLKFDPQNKMALKYIKQLETSNSH